MPLRGQSGNQPPRHGESDGTDRDVDQEDPPPAQRVDEEATGQRADEQADCGGGAPDTHRDAPPLCREGAGDQRERLRREQAAPIPWATRPPTSRSMESASPHHSDDSVKSASPAR